MLKLTPRWAIFSFVIFIVNHSEALGGLKGNCDAYGRRL